MSLVDPCSPMSNTIIFYIIIIITLVILKPEIMYCHKTNQFKAFGYGKNKTILSFSFVSITSAVILYMLFSTVESVCNKLKKK